VGEIHEGGVEDDTLRVSNFGDCFNHNVILCITCSASSGHSLLDRFLPPKRGETPVHGTHSGCMGRFHGLPWRSP
jgi:hypothetical protein